MELTNSHFPKIDATNAPRKFSTTTILMYRMRLHIASLTDDETTKCVQLSQSPNSNHNLPKHHTITNHTEQLDPHKPRYLCADDSLAVSVQPKTIRKH